MRQRAALLAHLQQTTRQDHLPESGKKIASQAHRAGVAARFPAPAVQQRRAVDLARLGHDDPLLRDGALAIGRPAKHHAATTLHLLRTVPGIGDLLRRVLLDASHALQRFPRVQAFVSDCRLGTGAQAAAGQRSGTSGTKIGPASLQGACAEAAGLCLRHHPQGQKSRPR